jgi:intein-encoded DNA endonuclease-like protein
MAYVLGFVTCDGYIVHNRNSKILGIDLSDKDIEVLEFVKSEICKTLKINHRRRFSKWRQKIYCGVNIRIVCKKIIEDLEKLGVTRNKTGKEIFPKVPEKYKMDYLRGLFDGDGCIHVAQRSDTKTKKVKISLCSCSKTFIEDINKNCLNGLGHIYKKKGYKVDFYVLEINARKQIINILKSMYNGNFCLKRKYDKYLEILEYDKLMSTNAVSVGTMKGLNTYSPN